MSAMFGHQHYVTPSITFVLNKLCICFNDFRGNARGKETSVLFSFPSTMRLTMVAAICGHERIFVDFHMVFYLVSLFL